MIFATVGTQLPFDRMIKTLDKWNKKQEVRDCFAQVGLGGYSPSTLEFSETLKPSQFAKRIANCKVIVSHAGMGTILTGLQLAKPIIVMPRLSSLGEHRNDHQLATVENLRGINGVHIADNEQGLMTALDHVQTLKAGGSFSRFAQASLLDAISNFVDTSTPKGWRHV